jgi:hypothetical protein
MCLASGRRGWDRMNVMTTQTGDADGGWCPPFFVHL